MPTDDRNRLSPREAKDLDIEIGFLEGLVRRDPAYTEALQVLADDYTRRGRLADGLNADQELARRRPDDALTHYNLACSLSLTGQVEEAAQAIHKALDLGYRDFKWLAEDSDLEALRGHPLFKTVRARIRALKADRP